MSVINCGYSLDESLLWSDFRYVKPTVLNTQIDQVQLHPIFSCMNLKDLSYDILMHKRF